MDYVGFEAVNTPISVNQINTRQNDWITGTIKTINSVKKFGFITPRTSVCGAIGRRGLPKDVHFYLDKAKWPVRLNEVVEFKLDMRKADKPTAWMIKRSGYPDDEQPQRAQIRHAPTRPRDKIRDRGPKYSAAQNNESSPMEVETIECRSDADISISESESNTSRSDSQSSDSDDECTSGARDNLEKLVKTVRVRKPLMFENREQLYGKIDHMRDNFGFITPKTTDADMSDDNARRQIYFNLSNVHSGNFALVAGDDVSYFESKGQSDRPYAINIRPVKLQRRSTEVFENYLGHLQGELNSTLGLEKIVLAITCVPIWQSLGNCRSLSIDAIAMLNTLIMHLDKYDSLSVNVAGILDTLLSTPLFKNIDGPYGNYVKMIKEQERQDKLQEMYQAIMTMARLVPHKVRILINLLEPIVSSNKDNLDNFFYKLLKQCTKGAAAGRVDDMDWDEMPLVPSVLELISGPLESTASLRSVLIVGPYPSAQEYVDIYFRLLRADCFSALSKGVTDLLKGKLDARDMNVYTHIKFAGVQITRGGSGISLGLTLVPQRAVANWDQSTNLLFGNLLCISVTGTFKDPIWATVVNRDLLKSHKMVIVDLCSESNSMSDSEAILSLYFMNTSTIMVESPTYYRAYQPILKSLQTMDPEELAFKEELVKCKSEGAPNTISDESEFPGSIIYDQFTTKLNAMCYCLDESSIGVTSLDASQEAAIKKCLRHRVAIVQGPPGTGKTFIGVKVVEILLSMNYSSENSVISKPATNSSLSNGTQHPPSTPIVILTYKNHALDEFLKEMLKIFPNQVARVGGRSQDLEISNCNLNELRQKMKMSADMFNQVKEFRSQLDRLKDEVENSFDSLTNKKYFNVETLVESLSHDQIIDFLQNCDWSNARVKALPDLAEDENGFRIVAKIVQRQDVIEIVKRCHGIKIHDILRSTSQSRDSLGGKLYYLLKGALKQWLPPISKFVQFERNFFEQNGGLSNTNSGHESVSFESAKQSDVNSRKMDLNEMLDVGETDVEDTLKERLAAMTTPSGNSREEILKSMKMLKGIATTEEKANGSRPYLMEIAKELSTRVPLGILLGVENIWELADVDRIKLVQCLLYRQFENEGASFDEIFTEYLKVCHAKEELEDQHKVGILRRMKVVGMTITGANIHRQLLSQLRPEIVIVEEAAEVLEPQLIAVIGSWVQHLIMIGDHLQLRPSVENYTLVKHYHLDVSMMERLINNDLPYASLTMQNRMKPEFANLLLDIYPRLQSNLSRVERNHQANCIEKSMYFWDHEDPEQSGRSYINENEAERAVRLALFLIMQGYAPETITILSPYLGQVSLIRRKVKKAESEFSNLFDMHILANTVKTDGDKTGAGKNSIHVHTVDLYQGDENDFVIISLVRSNAAGKLGFVGILNRRCVAQSRSRRGLYFIGNRKTIEQSKNWMPVLHKLREAGCVGNTLNINCPFHVESRMSIKDAASIPLTENFCNVICNKLKACNNHICFKKCQPRHSHARCQEIIEFTFQTCGHIGERYCYEEEKDIRCAASVSILKFEFCDHSGYRKCFQESKDVKCAELCTKILTCGHTCSDKCGDLCNSAACPACERIRDEEAKQRKELELIRRQVLLDSIDLEIKNIKRSNLETVQRMNLSKNGDTASEYLDIEDHVRLYVQPGHNWFPEVTQIEKLTNYKLELRWLETQKKLHDPSNHKLKFHGTNTEAVESIISTGFLMPKPQKKNKSMFGVGIYFASDSSKSAQDRYTKGSNMLLVCDVLLGKTYTVDTAMKYMTGFELNKKGYDSLFAKRGTKGTGGVLNDEFVVYNPDQALPRYIVHYKTIQYREAPCASQLEQVAIASNTGFMKHSLVNKRDAPAGDPYQFHFCVAESQFKRLMQKNHLPYKIESVDYYISLFNLERFNAATLAMKEKYSGTDDAKKCEFSLEFCSARSQDIETIVTANNSEHIKLLQSDERFGSGVYFSDYPDAIQSDNNPYGQKKLLLCKVLQGKSQTCKNNHEPRVEEYDSLRFNGDEHSFSRNELIIFNMDQILPLYVINFQ